METQPTIPGVDEALAELKAKIAESMGQDALFGAELEGGE